MADPNAPEKPAPRPRARPEILAPAGDFDALRAALASGADAVYFGLDDGFNARARATNFSRENLAAVVGEIHRAGARAYVTLNTLLFEVELPGVAAVIADVAAAGVDALIVQDPAVALLARAICPALELHASTQMTISSPEAAAFAASLGVTRVVVPRELSVDEIRRFAAGTDLELEVFVHGALCMSWSGQCLTSEAWGGRSANRGQCAQSCRMPYELVVDGERRPLGEVEYLLSPKDLAGFRAIPALCDVGVHSLKIEGRLKGPAYVMSAVESHRRWLDAVARGVTPADEAALAADMADLTVAYSRGFGDGFLGGSDHQTLVEGRFPKHRGLLLGRVAEVGPDSVRVVPDPDGRAPTGGAALTQTAGPAARGLGTPAAVLPALGGAPDAASGPPTAAPAPRPGVGVVFDDGHPEDQREPGGPVFSVDDLGPRGWRLGFGRPGPDLSRVTRGQRVWMTSDPALNRRAERLVAAAPPEGRVAVALWVRGEPGRPLRVGARAGHATAEVEGDGPLTVSLTGDGLTPALLTEKLAAFGGTCLRLGTLDTSGLAPRLHTPVSELKRLRRALVATLVPQIEAGPPRGVDREAWRGLVAGSDSNTAPASTSPDTKPQLVPLCRTEAQLEAVIALGLPEVELDFMEMVGLSRAVSRSRSAGLSVTLATVRVQKPGEEGYDRRLAALAPDAVLVRHWGGVMTFARGAGGGPEGGASGARPRVHGDFSLNVTNSLTFRRLLDLGLDTVTAAHDLDAAQLAALMEHIPVSRLAVTVHHHIPTYHTEHCVYAHLLSHGRDFRTCGRPCETHRVALRDHKGREHPVIVDVGCRNTVFNAEAQSAARLTPKLLAAGVRRFRAELVWETQAQATEVLSAWQALLAARITPAELLRRTGVHEQFGVTAGTMRILGP
jgi:putative protease